MFRIIVTFILINFTCIFFRASNVTQALDMIKSLVTQFNPWIFFDDSLYSLGLDRKEFGFMIISIIILIIADYVKWKGYSVREWVYKQDLWFRWGFYIISIMVVLIFGIWGPGYDQNAFIYFQF